MKKLPIYEPILSTFPEYGSVFSMLELNEVAENWLYSNFIQFYVRSNSYDGEILTYENHMNFLSNVPTIQHYKISEEMLFQNYSSFTDALINFIDNDYYISVILERFCLRNSKDYMIRTSIHQIFIYGYDKEKEIFFGKDNDETGKYKNLEYNFYDIEQAYKYTVYSGYRDTKTIHFFRNFNHKYFDFDITFLLKELKFYLNINDNKFLLNCNKINPLNYGYSKETVIYYSLGIYQYFNKILINKNFKIQPFHLVYEHKKLMVMRIKFLFKKEILEKNEITDQLLNDFEKFTNQWKIILIQITKYNLNNDQKIIDKIIEKLTILKTEEIRLIHQIINLIEGSSYYKKYLQL